MRVKVIYLTIISLFISLITHAHSGRESFFTIITDSFINIKAELPWTIREAIITENESLGNLKNKSEFQNAIKKYFEKHLKLFTEDDTNIPLLDIYELIDNENHAANYLLRYKNYTIKKIKNTILFSLKPKAINYHKIFIKNVEVKHNTTIENDTFELKHSTFNWLWIVLFFACAIIYYIYIKV